MIMECHRCGECCRRLAFDIGPNKNMYELLKIHGIEDPTRMMLIAYHKCPHLDQQTNLCKIYTDPKRPKICQTFICNRSQQQDKIRVEIKGAGKEFVTDQALQKGVEINVEKDGEK